MTEPLFKMVDGVAVEMSPEESAAILAEWAANAIPGVPQVVTPLQARKAINAAGLRASIEAAVAASGQDAKDAWEYATEIRRDNALIASMAAGLGLTSAQIDDLFRAAAAL
jgi:hypothetical protein